jgi:hypothetical protein
VTSLLAEANRSSSRLEINESPDFPKDPLYSLKPELPVSGSLSLLRPPITVCQSTGILTCFPSTTRFRLALGADSPCVDYRCAGNLGLSACGVFTRIIVTHVSIRTSDTSSNLLKSPSTAYRTLLYHAININTNRIHCFSIRFEPRSFFRADRFDQ